MIRDISAIASDASSERNDRSFPAAGRVLTVALPPDLRDSLPRHVLAPGADVLHAPFSEMANQVLSGPDAPDLILSPLVAPGFDAMDLLTHLQSAGFPGRYLVLAPLMPDLPLIRAEMRAQAGGLEIDIISLAASTTLHEV